MASSVSPVAEPQGLAVALVSTNADRAGAPLHVRSLATELATRGVRVMGVFGEDGPVVHALRGQGIECRVIPTMRSDLRFWRERTTLASLLDHLGDFRPDLIHAHSAKAGLVARLAARRLGVPCVYTVHGWGFGPGRSRVQAMLLAAVERTLVRMTAHYVAVSHADERLGRSRLGLRPEHITTIHNGVEDTPLRADPQSSRIVVMVARAHRQKDHETLLRATSGLPCELWLVGGGTDDPAFRTRMEPGGPDPARTVRYLGSRTDIPELLSRCGIFVLSSRYEGLPLSVIEAMRAGLPVLASDVGGVRELVRDGHNGAVFRSGDADALRGHLQALLDDDALRRRWGEAARSDYERGFAVAPMIRATLEVYRQARARACASAREAALRAGPVS